VDPRIDFCTSLTSPAEADPPVAVVAAVAVPVVAAVAVPVVAAVAVPVVAAPRWWNQSRRRNQ
jgi:hypothetical protein